MYADELEGRTYELRSGPAEPIIVVAYGEKTLVIDGHHRACAAQEVGIDSMQAYILSVSPAEVESLGFLETARLAGLESLTDIEVTDYVQHPLIEKTAPQV